MNPGGRGCSEPRLCHCTPAWVTRGRFYLKKKERKKKEREKERERERKLNKQKFAALKGLIRLTDTQLD